MTTNGQYNDDDLVYVDPETRSVVGPLQYDKNGNPKSLPYQKGEGLGQAELTTGKKQWWRKHYPFGTYRSMKRAYRIEGKQVEKWGGGVLEEILPKALGDVL